MFNLRTWPTQWMTSAHWPKRRRTSRGGRATSKPNGRSAQFQRPRHIGTTAHKNIPRRAELQGIVIPCRRGASISIVPRGFVASSQANGRAAPRRGERYSAGSVQVDLSRANERALTRSRHRSHPARPLRRAAAHESHDEVEGDGTATKKRPDTSTSAMPRRPREWPHGRSTYGCSRGRTAETTATVRSAAVRGRFGAAL